MPNNIKLKRVVFTTRRALEFFTEKELSMQLGHGRLFWWIALLKELVDNSLDACEIANVTPRINVEVKDDYFSVSDNGNRLPAFVIKKSLDYKIRVSDKAYYVSPTRGQLGNALKCVYAAPFVDNGVTGVVTIETSNRKYVIEVKLNRITQSPDIELSQTKHPGPKGVKITVFTPKSATLLQPLQNDEIYNLASDYITTAEELMAAYFLFNPHAVFSLNGKTWGTPDKKWTKWQPNNPTSAHWYNAETLRSLIAALISSGSDKSVREFVSEFRGLAGTKKQKVVTGNLCGVKLSQLVKDQDVDKAKVEQLLKAMQENSPIVAPRALGAIGKEHLMEGLKQLYSVSPESVHYKKVQDVDEKTGLPEVVEVVFGVFDEKHESNTRKVITGLNWSPTIGIPSNEIQHMLGDMRINRDDPVCVAIHIATPRLELAGHGKGEIADV
ncbi:MAG: hypothetical protein A2172_05260 [Candidatus Woykebacteria bacterium RBG_13_40_15]|uniref:Histidine kinase/HSP90-like ATPase domain-containing protein n=1 Tax=Candidatus Woykebacteria bacterium RBG_13_40_15 TaxID=1802593 RepID=A0A1G1WAT2_9BACT|nr:MAG: hypothetical protein A2172_05260 [Candidatus Woykebacteria bacterium RBG_13_40_15]